VAGDFVVLERRGSADAEVDGVSVGFGFPVVEVSL